MTYRIIPLAHPIDTTGNFDGGAFDMIAVEDRSAEVFVVEDDDEHFFFEGASCAECENWIAARL